MSDRWSWAREVWQQAFAGFTKAGFELDRVDSSDRYWNIHENEMRSHFPDEVFFGAWALRSEAERVGQKRLAEVTGGSRLEDFAIVRRSGAIAAMFCGHQLNTGTYRMWHSTVHADHRRKGIYSRIVAYTLDYTRELGFDTVVSEHAPCNNAVLIAKLKAGFRVTTLDIDATVGPSLWLRYFHNPQHLAAYEFRCGMASITPELMSNSSGAMPKLIAQITQGSNTEDKG